MNTHTHSLWLVSVEGMVAVGTATTRFPSHSAADPVKGENGEQKECVNTIH